MKEVEFNLLDEPWVRVLCADCTVREVSLTEALLHAHEYKGLAGELPTQDVAVLRLLRIQTRRWYAGGGCGVKDSSRSSRSGIIWWPGMSVFGCFTRNDRFGRHPMRKRVRTLEQRS